MADIQPQYIIAAVCIVWGVAGLLSKRHFYDRAHDVTAHGDSFSFNGKRANRLNAILIAAGLLVVVSVWLFVAAIIVFLL